MSTETLWLSPTDFVTGDKSLRITYPSVTHPAVEVKATAPGDLKWISLGLKIPPFHEISAVQVCYQLSNSGSFISQIRLAEMRTPDQAVVRHDDGTDLLSVQPTCYRSQLATGYRPDGAVLLELRLNFQNAVDTITLGAVGVEVGSYIPCIAVPSYTRGTLPAAGAPGCLARVTDSSRGLWMDQGSQWFSLSGEVFNVKEFGAKGDAVTDDIAAFETAIAAMSTVQDLQGGVLYVPTGAYRISRTLNITRPLRLLGASARFEDSSVLLFDDGVTGIVTWHPGMASPDGGYADGCSIEYLTIRANGRTQPDCHGIWMRTPTHVSHCHIRGFSGNGIHVTSEGKGFPDNWHVTWTRVSQCEDGIHVDGENTSNGVCVAGDFQDNRGWGVFESSFLGCTYIGCHTAENLKGPYFVDEGPGVTSLINCYSEGDQPPSRFIANTHVIGGLHGAGFTSDSSYFGGLTWQATHPTIFRSDTSVSNPSAIGANPPQVTLSGTLTDPSVSVRIEVTTPGYPGGIDANHQPVGPPASVRWSTDGGQSWNGPVALPRADNPGGYGLPKIQLGATGLTAHFTQGFYSGDNVWTAEGYGGSQTVFSAGSRDGTLAAFGWGHVSGTPGGDPGSWSLRFGALAGPWAKRWALLWANSPMYSSMYLSGGSAQPYPGTVVFNNLWYGTLDDERRIANADATAGVAGDTAWHNTIASNVGWWRPGDIVWNKSEAQRWPVAWRPMTRSGIASDAFGFNQPWRPSTGYYPGQSIAPGNGFIYRATVAGTTDAKNKPAWPTTAGQTVDDATQIWECAGTTPGSFEPILDCAPTMLVKDCSAGGTFTLTSDEIAHARFKLTGAPGGAFNVLIGSGVAGSWHRVVYNATNTAATVKAGDGDTGVAVPAQSAYLLLHDGSAIVRAT